MKRLAAALLLLWPAAAPALAQSVIDIDGGQVSGAATINAAAGARNQQLNAAAVAAGGFAHAHAGASQHHAAPQSPATPSATATIADGAFAGSSGWIAVNGAAGSDNQQANLAAFAFGIEVGTAADAALSQTRASQGPAGRPAQSPDALERRVGIADNAFEDASGLIQVSLIGGDRNTSANTFALSVSADAGP